MTYHVGDGNHPQMVVVCGIGFTTFMGITNCSRTQEKPLSKYTHRDPHTMRYPSLKTTTKYDYQYTVLEVTLAKSNKIVEQQLYKSCSGHVKSLAFDSPIKRREFKYS